MHRAAKVQILGSGGAGQPEVEQLDPVVVQQKDVRGLDVAVNDVMTVGAGQSVADLLENLRAALYRQRADLLHVFFEGFSSRYSMMMKMVL